MRNERDAETAFSFSADATLPSPAEDFRRHALTDVALRAAIRDQRDNRPRKHVDEAGSDRQPVCVDHAYCLISTQLTDRDDTIVFDADIGLDGISARAVVNLCRLLLECRSLFVLSETTRGMAEAEKRPTAEAPFA